MARKVGARIFCLPEDIVEVWTYELFLNFPYFPRNPKLVPISRLMSLTWTMLKSSWIMMILSKVTSSMIWHSKSFFRLTLRWTWWCLPRWCTLEEAIRALQCNYSLSSVLLQCTHSEVMPSVFWTKYFFPFYCFWLSLIIVILVRLRNFVIW